MQLLHTIENHEYFWKYLSCLAQYSNAGTIVTVNIRKNNLLNMLLALTGKKTVVTISPLTILFSTFLFLLFFIPLKTSENFGFLFSQGSKKMDKLHQKSSEQSCGFMALDITILMNTGKHPNPIQIIIKQIKHSKYN